MTFEHPAMLLLLWLLPAAAVLLAHAQRRRAAAARRLLDEPMVARLAPRLGGPRPWVKGSLWILGLALLITAAARPRFGVYFERVAQRGVDCFVLLDCSRSMLAEDVAPNRLERAKSDIRDLLKKLGGDRVGLIVFAGKSVLKVPLTADEAFFKMVLDEINVHSAPRGGTLIGDAIRKAVALLPPKADHDRVIVLITDGEDQDSYPLEAAKMAAEQGIKIFTVGLGDSAEGARIPLRDSAGKLDYVRDDAGVHWSKANQEVLRQIALTTGGAHIPAGTKAYDLGQIYEDHLAGLARGKAELEGRRKRYHDRYQIPLALAIACLVAEMLIPAYPNEKKRNGAGKNNRFASDGASTAGRRIVAAVLAVGLAASLGESAVAAPREAARKVDEGILAFQAGDFQAADRAFSEAEQSAPDEPRVAFNRGCALAALGETEKAADQFRAAALARDRDLAATAHYNLGCLAAAKAKTLFGAKPEDASSDLRRQGIETLQQAVSHLRDCLALDPSRTAARENLETIRLWIKHIQELWKQRDREKDRRDMNLLQFLDMLEKKQRELRSESRVAADLPDSPRRRAELRRIESGQRDLADEIEPLKRKIRESAANPGPNAATSQAAKPSPALNPDQEKALDALDRLADAVRDTMNAAANAIHAGKADEAVPKQSDAVEQLDGVFMAVAPFVDVVRKGIAAQEGLISLGDKRTISAKDANDTKEKQDEEKRQMPASNGARAGRTDAESEQRTDWPEAAWNQRFITRYGQVLPMKAKRELEQLSAMPAVPAGTPSAAPGAVSAAQPDPRKAMEEALQAGIELAPKVAELSRAAADDLDAARPADALPRQQEALELLKKMLPKQEQQQNDRNQQDQNKNQQQNQKDQDKKEQDKDKKEQEKQDQEKKEQEKKDKEKKDQEKQDQDEKSAAPKGEDFSKQQIEAALRRVRQRQQERKEQEKALLRELYRPDKVDKDW